MAYNPSMKNAQTSIRVSKATRDLLAAFARYGEPMDKVVRKLIAKVRGRKS